MSCAVVWFKRDLRLSDHEPLAAAIASGRPVLLLYCFEPELLGNRHYSARHWRFVWQSLMDMRRRLAEQQLRLCIYRGRPEDLFEALIAGGHLGNLYSYEETGLAVTFARDKRIAATLRTHAIPWQEFASNGVSRGRRNRQHWNRDWGLRMSAAEATADLTQVRGDRTAEQALEGFVLDNPPTSWSEPSEPFQSGGETAARATLATFLDQRCTRYAVDISKPESSRESCSRLSPYLAWGNLSIRQVYRARLSAR